MLSKEDVLAVAKLSRLDLTEEQVEKFGNQLSGVLDLFEKVKNVDVASVSETSQITGLENVTREDKVFYDDNLRPGDTKKLLSNIPIQKDTSIVVPKVIG